MSFTIEPLSPELPFGKTIRGLMAKHIHHEAVRAQLRGHLDRERLHQIL